VFSYVARRFLSGLVIVWGVYTLAFFAVNLAGDPFENRENPKVQEEDLQRLRVQWGYDRPVVERYFLHLRKMFWADPEVFETESAGILFEVRPGDAGPVLSARVQPPPATLRLVPTKTSVREKGSQEVVLERAPDGTYPAMAIRPGKYLVGRRSVMVGDLEATLVTQGVALRFAAGSVSAAPALAAPPPEVRLVREGKPPLVLPAGGDGAYGPVVVAEPDRYRHEGGSADVLVPAELDRGGPTFSLGVSIMTGQPVVGYLLDPFVNTLILATAALLLNYVLGILLGVIAAVRQNSRLDHALTLGSLFFYSMPGFWLAVMLQLLFAIKLKWLPAEGMHGVQESGFLDLLQHLVLPAIVLGIGGAASVARYQRSALLEVMTQDYIRTARAKGLDERTVVWRHAIRNALLPTITLFGMSLPFLVSGAVIAEQIFSWPGIGREALNAINFRDVFVITGITLMATIMVVVGNLLADVLYALVDPRVRLE
jgi:peptide/nickel transport system permease protein